MSAPPSEKVDLSKYIELRDGRPNIRGRRLPVSALGRAFRESRRRIEEISFSCSASEAQVIAGILYYLENKAEVEELEDDLTRLLEIARQRDRIANEVRGRDV